MPVRRASETFGRNANQYQPRNWRRISQNETDEDCDSFNPSIIRMSYSDILPDNTFYYNTKEVEKKKN